MDKSEAIKIVRAYKSLLKDHFPLEKVYLFGSYAKGTNREDSDIDVAIVVKKMDGDFFFVNPLLWKLRRQIDDRIEPILIESDFDEAGFLEEIQKNGIEVA
jgi:uncharacterized protein